MTSITLKSRALCERDAVSSKEGRNISEFNEVKPIKAE